MYVPTRCNGTNFRHIMVCGLLVLAAICPAQAQTSPDGARPGNEIGTGQSLPLSDKASNISPPLSGSAIAPRLPSPPISDSAPPIDFLKAAAQALAAGRTGEAQEAMERAETRALARSVRPSLARKPDQRPLVQQIAAARQALAGGDRALAVQLLQHAMQDPDASAPDQ